MQLFPSPPITRADAEDLQSQAKSLETIPSLQRVLNALPGMTMILNRQRQIVMASQSLLDFVGAAGLDDACGLRPGEALLCARGSMAPDGCGSTEHCTVCGALRALITSQFAVSDRQICRMVRLGPRGEEPLELEITASPVGIGEHQFTIVYASGALDRLRCERLEQIAVPQALELAFEISILAASLSSSEMPPEARNKTAALIAASSRRIATLMRAHTELDCAEAGELRVERRPVSALDLLRNATRQLQYHPAADGKTLRLDANEQGTEVDTDPVLVGRVLEKLIVNAFEATAQGGQVALDCGRVGTNVELRIHNNGEISREVQLQLFQRSFSTKGRGRGYGTYFAKLITERYLGGSVSLLSTGAEGTVFSVTLPVVPIESTGIK